MLFLFFRVFSQVGCGLLKHVHDMKTLGYCPGKKNFSQPPNVVKGVEIKFVDSLFIGKAHKPACLYAIYDSQN